MPRLVACLLLALCAATALAQPAAENLDLYYAVRRQATLYAGADSSRPYARLRFREPVYLLQREGHWSRVKTLDGVQGYVPAQAISNTWLRVSKEAQTLYVYEGIRLVKEIPVDLGYNYFADKERRGSQTEPDHWRTPDGTFFIVRKNAQSKFYKALVLNYPTSDDAERGLRQGLIGRAEYEAIVQAERNFEMPPMHTELGGMIEIHGAGTGARSNWTQGCIAVRNVHIDDLWDLVEVGTPVLIEP
jgi:hypothetical protein